MRKESSLTKWTLGILGLILIAYFSTNARGDDNEDVAKVAAICAAANGLATLEMNDGILTDAIRSEGEWWVAFLKEWIGDDAAIVAITGVLKELQSSYNSGNTSWEEIILLARHCAPIKEELIKLSEGDTR